MRLLQAEINFEQAYGSRKLALYLLTFRQLLACRQSSCTDPCVSRMAALSPLELYCCLPAETTGK